MDASLFHHFVIMNLKELSAEQQRRAIANQLEDSEQFVHLAAFGEIRQVQPRVLRHSDECSAALIRSSQVQS